MIKNYIFIICISFLVFFSLKANADTITVSITNNAFTPSTFSAQVGDVVKWVWNSGGTAHNVTSTSQSIPAGAAPLASGNLTSGTYIYTITLAGNYGYSCTLHMLSGMAGGFNVTTTGISKPVLNLSATVYPNPFKDKVIIKYSGVESIDVVNIVGEKVKTIELNATENKTEVTFDEFPSGIYFFRIYKDGDIIETKRVIKSE